MTIRIGHIEENYLVIVRSGAPEPGKWFEEKINLYEDSLLSQRCLIEIV